MITITAIAAERIRGFMDAEGRPGLALRFGIEGRGPGGFQYRLAFVDAAERTGTDTVVEAGSFQVYIDAASVPNLQGVTIDYVEDARESGFKIENPNPLWAEPLAQAVQKVLEDDINPAVASHGGWVSLLDVKDGIAYVQLGGGCQGCGMADVTLKQGIERTLRARLPAITAVRDVTDHASGDQPYYKGRQGSSAVG
jgi:Fe/S biogenesis protein NfuA